MYTRFPNSIAALIVTGNCTAEVFHSAKRIFSCAKRGLAHYNEPCWDHYQFMPVSLHLSAGGRERALHQLDKDPPPSPTYYQATLAWQPACNLSRWTTVCCHFARLLPHAAATVIHGASVEFLARSPFWHPFKLAPSSETQHWLNRSCVSKIMKIHFPQKTAWHGIFDLSFSVVKCLSSLLMSHCLPAHLRLWNEEVLHMVSTTGKIIKTLM